MPDGDHHLKADSQTQVAFPPVQECEMITEFTASQLHAKAVHDRLMGKPRRKYPPIPKLELRRIAFIEPIPIPEPPELVTKPRPGAWKAVAVEVAGKYRVTLEGLANGGRTRLFVTARHELWYRLNNEIGMPASRIARLTGGFDHSSVLHGIQKHQSRMEALAQERT